MSRQAPSSTQLPLPSPHRNRLSLAIDSSRLDPSAGDRPHPAMLERLEAIYRAIQQVPSLDHAIRLPELLAIVGVSKSTWYARLNVNSPSYDPRAPKPFKLGTSERSPSVWWRSAVMAYVTACADAQVKR